MQLSMLVEFTATNISRGQKFGAPNTDANVYAVHNLGSGDGPTFLKALVADPTTLVRDVLDRKVYVGNSSLYRDGSITLSDAYARMAKAMATGQKFADEAQAMQKARYGK